MKPFERRPTVDLMDEPIDRNRRRLLGTAALTVAAAQLGFFDRLAASGEADGLAAIGRSVEWLNSPRLTSSSLSGKVVLVDFGTYTCINWLRTLPYRRAWAQKYASGLVLIGVHTPEFGFEKNVDNVRRAVRQLRIEHPIVIDNEYAIWRAFNNNYWPALYLIDARGRVRQHHFGEGAYERTESTIQRLLADAGAGASSGFVSPDAAGIEAAADWATLQSQETYVGYARTERFASPGGVTRDRRRTYAAPGRLTRNHWALSGEWTMGREATTLAGPAGRIVCRFHARDLHLVMGPPRPGTAVRFRVTLDSQAPGAAQGLDVDEGGQGIAGEQRLYQLVRQPGPILDRQFEIEFLDAGVEAFAFTFG